MPPRKIPSKCTVKSLNVFIRWVLDGDIYHIHSAVKTEGGQYHMLDYKQYAKDDWDQIASRQLKIDKLFEDV